MSPSIPERIATLRTTAADLALLPERARTFGRVVRQSGLLFEFGLTGLRFAAGALRKGGRNPSLIFALHGANSPGQARDLLARPARDVRGARRPDEPGRRGPPAAGLPAQHERRHHDAQPSRVPGGAGGGRAARLRRGQRLVAVDRSGARVSGAALRGQGDRLRSGPLACRRAGEEEPPGHRRQEFHRRRRGRSGVRSLRGGLPRSAGARPWRSTRTSRRTRLSSSTRRGRRASRRAPCASSRRTRCTPACSSSARRRCAPTTSTSSRARSTTRPRSGSSRSPRSSAERPCSWTSSSPSSFLQLVERHGVTTTAVVPTILHRVMALGPSVLEKYDVRSVRGDLHRRRAAARRRSARS